MTQNFKKFINHVIINNQKIFVTIEEWAETLTYQEYCKFKNSQQRNNLLIKKYSDEGLIYINPLKEEITKKLYDYDTSTMRSRTVQMKIGEEIFLTGNITIDQITDDEYKTWEKRYNSEFKMIALGKIKTLQAKNAN